MASILQLFHIAAPRHRVYEAIATIDGLGNWWTTETRGNYLPGGEIEFRFGPLGPGFKVTAMIRDEMVSWTCISGFEDWIGTSVTFHLDENEGKTRVRFSHDNWREASDFFAACNFTWGRFLESLKQLCQAGTGKPFGGEQYGK